MRKGFIGPAIVLVLAMVLAAGPVAAQQTSGNITGRVLDAQGSVVPGATVTAVQQESGFTRVDVSDTEGVYRLSALPVGHYNVTVELQGFTTVKREGIVVAVGQTLSVDVTLTVGALSETVTVTGESPLIEVTASSVGGVVDVGRIESLPLNGRQFANLAATIPGVGLGFHSDPTKSTQYFDRRSTAATGATSTTRLTAATTTTTRWAASSSSTRSRPSRSSTSVTSRSKAEYGRSQGGVLNVVTKSGTNQLRGSWFTLFRDKSMNAITETEKNNDSPRTSKDYRRYQYRWQRRRADRARQDPLLRRLRADPAGHLPDRQHRGAVPEPRRHVRDAVPRDADYDEGDGEPQPAALPVRPVRPQPERAALRRRSPDAAQRLGRQQEHVQLDQRELQLGDRRVEAERGHLPVRHVQEQHLRQQPGSQRVVPERRGGRPEQSTRRRRPSRRSGSSTTTSRGT